MKCGYVLREYLKEKGSGESIYFNNNNYNNTKHLYSTLQRTQRLNFWTFIDIMIEYVSNFTKNPDKIGKLS